jgi:hypothetical protein
MVGMGPYWRLGLMVLSAFLFIEGVAGTVSSVAAAGHSRSVQSHGIRATGLVVLVASDSGPQTAAVTVTLQPLASLQVIGTTVHVPSQVHYRYGQRITVLVDPSDPGYAELPGEPDATIGAITVPVLAIIISVIAGGFALFSALRLRRLERAWEEAANARERDWSPWGTSVPPPSGRDDLR